MDEAKLASVKLRSWTGDKGVYANLFDRRTTMRLDASWLFFDVEGLSSDPQLETAMSMVIAHAVSERASGKTGQPSITVLDECWALLDSPSLAPEVVQLFRTARKRYGSVWGISQTPEDLSAQKRSRASTVREFLRMSQPRSSASSRVTQASSSSISRSILQQ